LGCVYHAATSIANSWPVASVFNMLFVVVDARDLKRDLNVTADMVAGLANATKVKG